MNVIIIHTRMTYSKEDGYVGAVHFEVEGHPKAYEMTLQSRRGTREWGYGLFFLNGSGDEDLLLQVEDEIEENDELFDQLVAAGRAAYVQNNEAQKDEAQSND